MPKEELADRVNEKIWPVIRRKGPDGTKHIWAMPYGDPLGKGGQFAVQSYLRHHARKLARRFDANTYLYLTMAMDDYDLAEGRGSVESVLKGMDMPALVMGIDSDVLYPEAEAKALADRLPQARYARIQSPHGHDAFLIEFPQVAAQLRRFLEAD